ncbi:MAG: ankyrin repeat domain-containing protein [Phycisphaerae bacterium]
MNAKIRYVIRIVAALFLIIGVIGFLAGAVTGLGFEFRNLDSFELPLGCLEGIAVDSEGNIYCGLQFYSRIQVYDPEGKFIYGKFVNSAGGAFRIRINKKDQLEVATARNDKLYVFEKDGALANELSDVGHNFSLFGETGEKRFHDKNKNTTYLIKWSPLGSYISKRYSSGEEKVIIKTPFHKWLFMGPLPAWLFALIGVVMLKLVKKNPFKNILRRKQMKNQIVDVFEGNKVPGKPTINQDNGRRNYKRWLICLCCLVAVCFLLAGFVFFHLIGHHIFRWSLGHIYTPPALNQEKLVLYNDLVRLIKAHPEYSRFHLDSSGPGRQVIRDMLSGKKGFLWYEVDELTRISREFERVNCVRADKYDSYVVFFPRPNYVLPTSPGVLYSLDGGNPNEINDEFLNGKKPFKLIKEHWYTSKWLAVNPLPSIGNEKWRLPNSLIDLSLRDPGPGSKKTPIILWKAARSGDIKRVQSIISSGADINAKNEEGFTPLYSAVERGQKVVVELLIANGADINAKGKNGQTPLHYTAQQGHADVAELLLANGADINAIDNAKRTPLNYALRWGKQDVAELLVTQGADVNAKDATGGTPLHYAVSRRYDNIVKQLITKGADVNAKRANGETPLHYTVREGNVNAVEMLLANGADINAKNNENSTPLHIAVIRERVDVVKLLIVKGADANARDKQGLTAMDLARAAGQTEIVKLLKTAD